MYDKMQANGHMVPVHVYAAMMQAKRQRQQLMDEYSIQKRPKVIKQKPKGENTELELDIEKSE